MRRTTNKDLNSIENPNKSADGSSLREKKQRQKRAVPENLFLNTYTASNGGSLGTTFNGYGIQALPSNGGTVLLINQPYTADTNRVTASTMIARLNSIGVMTSLLSLQGSRPLNPNIDPLAACISSDNGIMISGVATESNENIIVMKLDATTMSVKWASTFPLVPGDLRQIEHFKGTNGAPSTIACTSDGGVIFSAFSNYTLPDIIFSKLNSNGQTLWSYSMTATGSLPYLPGRTTTYLPYPVPFYVSADGSIVMTYTPNTQFSYKGSGTLFDTATMIVTAKLNLASQTTTWATVWGVPSPSDSFASNLATAISPTMDGGTAISVYSSNTLAENYNPDSSVILKLTAQGAGAFASLFGGTATSGGCRPNALIEDVDAGLIAVGSTSGPVGTYHFQTHITKLTANGAFKWQSILSSPSQTCPLFCAANAYVNSADNTIILSGGISSGCLGSGSLFVAKAPTDGSTFGCQQLQSTTPGLFGSVNATTTPIKMSIRPYTLIATDRTKNIISQSLTPTQQAPCSTVKTPPPTPAPKTSSSSRLVPFFSLPVFSSATISPSAWLGYAKENTAQSPIYQISRGNCEDVQNGRFVELPSTYCQTKPSVNIDGQLMLARVWVYLAKKAYSWMTGTSSSEHSVKNNNVLNSKLSPVDRSSLFSSSAGASTGISANTVTQLSTGKSAEVSVTRQCLGR